MAAFYPQISLETQKIITTLCDRRDTLVAALNGIDGVSVYKPEVTFYLFPEVTGVYKRMGYTSEVEFRMDTLRQTGVSFCSRSHFGKPQQGEDRIFIRFAYSGIDTSRIREGLEKLKAFWSR